MVASVNIFFWHFFDPEQTRSKLLLQRRQLYRSQWNSIGMVNMAGTKTTNASAAGGGWNNVGWGGYWGGCGCCQVWVPPPPAPLRLGLLAGAIEKRYLARAVRCAAPFCDLMRPFAIAVRSGLHIDEIELKRDDVAGMAVHIAARVAVEAKVGETVVSSIVRDLVAGSGLRFEDRGLDSLRGLPDRCTFTRFRVANKGGWGQRAELPLAGSWSYAIKKISDQ